MVKSTDDFDDFNIDDGFDGEGLFEDVPYDEPEGVSKKNKSIIKTIIIMALLGSVVTYATFTFMRQNSKQKDMPIVQITDILKEREVMLVDPLKTDNIVVVDTKDSKPKFDNSVNITGSILTPMPDGAAKNIILTELVGKKREIKQNIDLAKDEGSITAGDILKSLNEDDLLPQTEVIFKEPSIIAPVVQYKPLKEVVLSDAEEAIGVDDNNSKDINKATPIKPPMPKVKSINSNKKSIKKPKSKAVNWVIRAAQPKNAVIYNKSAGDMLSIEVNDVVKGIGRIKAIKIINGLWVITGTSGKITQ